MSASMFGRVFVPARTTEKLLVPEVCMARRGDLPTVMVPAGRSWARC